MKTKTSLIIIGLVAIAAIAAGTVLGFNLLSEKPIEKKTPSTLYCDIKDNNTLISVKKGNQVNLTLQDYGDGGYSWRFVALDEQFLKKESEQLSWGSTGMLGDFGRDTWIFTALNTGSTTLKLECVRLFDTTDIAQTFVVTVNIQ